MLHEEARSRDGTLRPRRSRASRGDSFDLILIDRGAARRGVHARLAGAILAATLACACAAFALFGSLDRFALMSAIATGLASTSAAIALILSARREETMHRLAHDLTHQPLLEDRREQATDGSV
jgi:hypothetical protein